MKREGITSSNSISGFFKRLYGIILTDTRNITKKYPNISKVLFFVLFFFLVSVWFKTLWLLFVFVLLDRIFVFLERHTSLTLKIEHITIAAIITGYYISIWYSLLITLIMMSILQIRNIKMTFLGAFIDGSIWLLFCVVAHFSAIFGISLMIIGFILPIARFLFKLVLNFMFGFEVHDLHKDSMNMIYQIFFLRYLTRFIV